MDASLATRWVGAGFQSPVSGHHGMQPKVGLSETIEGVSLG